jgi:hypothetical protein
MKIGRKAGVAFAFAVGAVVAASTVYADDHGTMTMAPSSEIAVALSDQELAKQRGGFLGIAFSATFTATIDNLTGNVSGTGSSSTAPTSGLTATNPPATYNIENGQVTLSTFIGNFSGNSGVFNFTTVNGFGNVVSSHLTLNVALITMAPGATMPALNTFFPQ